MKKINTVAVIDDDSIYQFASKKMIAATALVENVITFSDGQEAIDFFNQNLNNSEALPDIIFLDLNMPITDGWQFLDQYKLIEKEIDKDIHIYVTSSSKNPDDLILAKSIATVSDYVIKPLTFENFESLLTKHYV